MIVMYESLSRALDAFNANRIDEEQVEWHELVSEIKNPLDEKEVMSLIIDLYEDACEKLYKLPRTDRQGLVSPTLYKVQHDLPVFIKGYRFYDASYQSPLIFSIKIVINLFPPAIQKRFNT